MYISATFFSTFSVFPFFLSSLIWWLWCSFDLFSSLPSQFELYRALKLPCKIISGNVIISVSIVEIFFFSLYFFSFSLSLSLFLYIILYLLLQFVNMLPPLRLPLYTFTQFHYFFHFFSSLYRMESKLIYLFLLLYLFIISKT